MLVQGWRLGFVVLLVAGAVAATASPASATFRGRNGRLTVSDDRFPPTPPNGCNDILACAPVHVLVSVNPDGSGRQERTVSNESWDYTASPDGRRLAYTDKGGIWVSDADGANARQISSYGHNPSWSPDGRRLVFVTASITIFGGGSPFAIIDADGRGRHLLGEPGQVSGFDPKWSPNGKTIAFVRPGAGTYGPTDVYTVSGGGGQPRLLYRSPRPYGHVDAIDWSPSGRQLVMKLTVQTPDCEGCSPSEIPPPARPRDIEKSGIDVIDNKGHHFHRLRKLGDAAIWSPDGRRIAIVSGALNAALYTIDRHGHHLRRLLTFGTLGGFPPPPTWLAR